MGASLQNKRKVGRIKIATNNISKTVLAIDELDSVPINILSDKRIFCYTPIACQPPNGLRYLRWGGDGEAVQPEK